MPNYTLVNLAPAVSQFTPGVSLVNLAPAISEYTPKTASFLLAPAINEYVPSFAVFGMPGVIGEYVPSFAVFGMSLAVCETPSELSAAMIDACQFSAEYPLLFTQTELTQPKNVNIDLIDFAELGGGSIGRSVVFFGGCGFSVGDMADLTPSVWDEEQARIYPSLITTCSDFASIGSPEVMQ